MFVDALKEVKSLIFEQPELNPEKEVPKIAEKNEVNEDTLIMFHGLFSNLKYEIDKAPEETEDNSDENKKDPWLQSEVDIVMLYMDERKNYEEPPAEVDGEMKTGVLASFSHLGMLLDKAWKGVRFKYYDVKKNLKLLEANGSLATENFVPEAPAIPVKRGRGRPRKQHLTVVEPIREQNIIKEEDYKETIEKPILETIPNAAKIEENERELENLAALANNDTNSSEYETSISEVVLSQPTPVNSNSTKEKKSLFELFSEINRNLTFISIHSDEENDAEEQLYDLIKTIHGFIHMAAKNLDSAIKYKESEKKIESANNQINSFKRIAEENREDFLNMKDKAREKSEKIKNDILQYSRLSDMQKMENLDLLTRKMLNFVKQVETLDSTEDLYTELERRRFIDKNGILQTLS